MATSGYSSKDGGTAIEKNTRKPISKTRSATGQGSRASYSKNRNESRHSCESTQQAYLKQIIENVRLRLRGWLSGEENRLFLQRTRVPFPALRWKLTSICNSGSELGLGSGPDPLTAPEGAWACKWCTHMQEKYPHK